MNVQEVYDRLQSQYAAYNRKSAESREILEQITKCDDPKQRRKLYSQRDSVLNAISSISLKINKTKTELTNEVVE